LLATYDDDRGLKGNHGPQEQRNRLQQIVSVSRALTGAWLAGTWVLLLVAGCAPTPDPEGRTALFPSSYEESRARFRQACAAAVASPADACISHAVTSPTDPDLTIDEALFHAAGGHARRLLVLQSGIHGAEAAPGAAVQARFMQAYLGRFLAIGTDVLLIHAVDPFGYKKNLRSDEFNVNLNRNFSADGSIYHTANPDYVRHRSWIEPHGKVGAADFATLAVRAAFLAALAADGFDSHSLLIGLDSGQYDYPHGLNYGGRAPAQQTRILEAILRPVFAHGYDQVLYLDFHTGLGNDGELAVIRGIAPPKAPLAALWALLGGRAKQGIVLRGPDDPGFFPTVGDVIDFVPSLASGNRVLAVTMEYGTLGIDPLSQLDSAGRLILQNQANTFGCVRAADCARISAEFAGLFNPTDTAWRVRVLDEADTVFTALLEAR
jgi:hypothetical protein